MAVSEMYEVLEPRKRRGSLSFWEGGHMEEVRVEEIRTWVTWPASGQCFPPPPGSPQMRNGPN